jgi:sulfur-oxidizing protein SoxX
MAGGRSLGLALAVGVAALAVGSGVTAQPLVAWQARGDAIPRPLVEAMPDAARGREIAFGRDGNCLLCHGAPDAGARPVGNLAPPLAGVGSRLDAGQLRLRVVDPSRVNPGSLMPRYHVTEGLSQVAEAWRGRPVLSAEQIEDVVAWLSTLR